MKPRIYLAGPITGLTLEAADDWRQKVTRVLLPDFQLFSPLRGKQALSGKGVLGDGYQSDPLLTDSAIFHRDLHDVRCADLIFANLLGATMPSQGTNFELAWAFLLGKPAIVVMEDTGNPHEHLFVRQAATFRTDNLPDACEMVRSILLP